MSYNFNLIISHPHRQQSVYWWPLMVQRAGVPVRFITGLYYKPTQFPYTLVKLLPTSWQPSVLDKLALRRVLELDDIVTSVGGPWLELACKPLGLYRHWYKTFDWLTSRWIDHHAESKCRTILHCFDIYSNHTIRAAQEKGFTSVLEITYPPSIYRIVYEEKCRLGLVPGEPSPDSEIIAELHIADYVVAQSLFSVRSLLEYGVSPKKIVLQPLGVDTDRFYPSLPKDPHRPFRVCFAGQVDIRKGLHHLLEAWKQLDLPKSELVLAGVPQSEHGWKLLEQYKGCYRWLGFVGASDLPDVYRESDIFVLPSLGEGGSNVVYEALASGLPCIVSENAGLVVRDGVEGFVVPVGDILCLKDRIERLYLDANLREQMGIAARKQAERFTWNHFGRRLILMYERIASGVKLPNTGILDMTNE